MGGGKSPFMHNVEQSKIDEEEDDEDYQTQSPKRHNQQSQVLDTTKSDRVITNPTKKSGA